VTRTVTEILRAGFSLELFALQRLGKGRSNPLKWMHFILLAAICACSVALITAVDNAAAAILGLFAPSLQCVAWVRVPSLLACAAMFFITNPADSYRLPQATSITFSVVALALLWLLPAAYAVLVAKIWVPSLPRWIDVVAFMLTGLLAEELLFRGAIFQMATRAAGSHTALAAWAAVLVSAGFFALQHIQYHGFQLSPAAAVQISYTFVMGIVFGLLRHKTGSIWTPIAVHMINNAFAWWRNLS
jgi:membrane protease YdiL (CAAX protease family)